MYAHLVVWRIHVVAEAGAAHGGFRLARRSLGHERVGLPAVTQEEDQQGGQCSQQEQDHDDGGGDSSGVAACLAVAACTATCGGQGAALEVGEGWLQC